MESKNVLEGPTSKPTFYLGKKENNLVKPICMKKGECGSKSLEFVPLGRPNLNYLLL